MAAVMQKAQQQQAARVATLGPSAPRARPSRPTIRTNTLTGHAPGCRCCAHTLSSGVARLSRSKCGGGVVARAAPPAAQEVPTDLAMVDRVKMMHSHFPKALNLDDYMNRVEVALSGYGFTGDNSIAMSNLCRDESCLLLEDKIEGVFGSCFSTHGLGGVLTCGVIGIKAGLSHSPVDGDKEQYVFFSFPHIAIDSAGAVGSISRPNRPGKSAACGALCACLGEVQSNNLDDLCRMPGEHDPLDPEYSILKQRLARRLKYEGINPKDLDLVSITNAAERTISSDLEYLISKAVDTSKANYAVFTGVQIHNWSRDLGSGSEDSGVPSLEWVSPHKSYVVVNGERTYLDLDQVPALSPRMLRLLAGPEAAECDEAHGIQEIPRSVLMKRLGGTGVGKGSKGAGSTWRDNIKTAYTEKHPNAPMMDTALGEEKAFADTASHAEEEDEAATSFMFPGTDSSYVDAWKKATGTA